MRKKLHWAVLLFALGGMGVGCAQDGEFNPYGSDWALGGDWSVGGRTPDLERCGPIATVQVVFLADGLAFDVPELAFPCAAGVFQSDAIFRYGSYEAQWRALDASGAPLGQGRPESLEVVSPMRRVTLIGVDFEVE